MDAFQALTNSPFATRATLDENFGDNDGGCFYSSDGEATNVDHTIYQEGADCGRASGHYIHTNDLRGRRIAPNR